MRTNQALKRLITDLRALCNAQTLISSAEVASLVDATERRARDEESEIPQPTVMDKVDVGKIHRGDVVFTAWPCGTFPPPDEMYKVLRVHKKGRRVSLITPDGVQLERPLCELTHRWPKEQVGRLPITWRFDPESMSESGEPR